MSDYWMRRLECERTQVAAHHAKIVDVCYLTGYYGAKAEQSGNAELRALVAELRNVIDGTWDRSVMTE